MTIPPREELIHAATEKAMALADGPLDELIREAVDRAVAGLEWTGDVDPPATIALKDGLRRVLRQLVENAYRFPKVGDRVRTMEVIERFPHFIVPVGELGTVTEVRVHKGQKRGLAGVEHLAVRLDGYQPELGEWGNEVWFDDCEFEQVESALEVLPAVDRGEITAAQAQRLSVLLAACTQRGAKPQARVELEDPGPGGDGRPNLLVIAPGEWHRIAPDGSVDVQPSENAVRPRP